MPGTGDFRTFVEKKIEQKQDEKYFRDADVDYGDLTPATSAEKRKLDKLQAEKTANYMDAYDNGGIEGLARAMSPQEMGVKSEIINKDHVIPVSAVEFEKGKLVQNGVEISSSYHSSYGNNKAQQEFLKKEKELSEPDSKSNGFTLRSRDSENPQNQSGRHYAIIYVLNELRDKAYGFATDFRGKVEQFDRYYSYLSGAKGTVPEGTLSMSIENREILHTKTIIEAIKYAFGDTPLTPEAKAHIRRLEEIGDLRKYCEEYDKKVKEIEKLILEALKELNGDRKAIRDFVRAYVAKRAKVGHLFDDSILTPEQLFDQLKKREYQNPKTYLFNGQSEIREQGNSIQNYLPGSDNTLKDVYTSFQKGSQVLSNAQNTEFFVTPHSNVHLGLNADRTALSISLVYPADPIRGDVRPSQFLSEVPSFMQSINPLIDFVGRFITGIRGGRYPRLYDDSSVKSETEELFDEDLKPDDGFGGTKYSQISAQKQNLNTNSKIQQNKTLTGREKKISRAKGVSPQRSNSAEANSNDLRNEEVIDVLHKGNSHRSNNKRELIHRSSNEQLIDHRDVVGNLSYNLGDSQEIKQESINLLTEGSQNENRDSEIKSRDELNAEVKESLYTTNLFQANPTLVTTHDNLFAYDIEKLVSKAEETNNETATKEQRKHSETSADANRYAESLSSSVRLGSQIFQNETPIVFIEDVANEKTQVRGTRREKRNARELRKQSLKKVKRIRALRAILRSYRSQAGFQFNMLVRAIASHSRFKRDEALILLLSLFEMLKVSMDERKRILDELELSNEKLHSLEPTVYKVMEILRSYRLSVSKGVSESAIEPA